jgi:hypothetical protein
VLPPLPFCIPYLLNLSIGAAWLTFAFKKKKKSQDKNYK